MKGTTNVTESNNSSKCIVCNYWYFNHGFKFKKFVCNGYHDVLSPKIILLSSLLKVLFIIVLFMTLSKLVLENSFVRKFQAQ